MMKKYSIPEILENFKNEDLTIGSAKSSTIPNLIDISRAEEKLRRMESQNIVVTREKFPNLRNCLLFWVFITFKPMGKPNLHVFHYQNLDNL